MPAMNTHHLRIPAVLIVLCLLSSCRDEDAHKEINDLRSFMLNISDESSDTKAAVFNSSSKGYQFLRTTAGRFFIKLGQIEPYLDGHKITIQIGNPFLTTFSGFSLNVDFGVRPPTYPSSEIGSQDDSVKLNLLTYQINNNAWKKTLKHETIAFTEILLPGKWTTVQFHLSPSKLEDIGHVAISLKTDKVSLSEQP